MRKYFFLTILIAVLILTGCGRLSGNDSAKKLNEDSGEMEEQGNEKEIEKFPPEVDRRGEETFENWNTFQNEEYGFEIRYPESWSLEKDGRAYIISPQDIEHYEIGSNNAPVSFGIYTKDKNLFLENENYLDFSDIKYKLENCKRSKDDEVIKMGGRDFEKYDLIDYGRYEGASAGNIVIVISPEIEKNGDKLNIIFEWQERPAGKELEENDKDKFFEILSTFKFIDQEISTENWKTYRNEEYGFELKYPSEWEIAAENLQGDIYFYHKDRRNEKGKVINMMYINESIININYEYNRPFNNYIHSDVKQSSMGDVNFLIFEEILDNEDGIGYFSKWESNIHNETFINMRADFQSKNPIVIEDEYGKWEKFIYLYPFHENEEVSEDIFRKICASFKFIK